MFQLFGTKLVDHSIFLIVCCITLAVCCLIPAPGPKGLAPGRRKEQNKIIKTEHSIAHNQKNPQQPRPLQMRGCQIQYKLRFLHTRWPTFGTETV